MGKKQINIFLVIMITTMLAIGFRTAMKDDPLLDPKPPITDEDQSQEPMVIGTLEIEEGDMLERDIIPQLSLVFELSEEEVKGILALPLESYLIRAGLTDFRRMEGILPPGRYEIAEGETLVEWSKRMVEGAEKRYTDLLARAGQSNPLKPDEQMVLASIVEAECLVNEQYTEAAAVFLNRLDNQDPLQSCVTAEYALGFQRPFLYGEDVKIQHPYNTYVVDGLPPGPICCVDDESLVAAIKPSSDQTLYYFFYDYLLNEMFFYADYSVFKTEAAASRERFAADPLVGMRDKINKQTLFGSAVQKKELE